MVSLDYSYDLSFSPSIPSTHSSLSHFPRATLVHKGFYTSDQYRDFYLGAIRTEALATAQFLCLCARDFDDTLRNHPISRLALLSPAFLLHIPYQRQTEACRRAAIGRTIRA